MGKVRHSIGVVACGVALFATGVALADNPGHPKGQTAVPTTTATADTVTTTTTSTLPSSAKGYGFYCQNQSKAHIAGQKGTAFSRCVTAMAKLVHGDTKSPKAACDTLSRRPDGHGGSPFSRCVSSGERLLKNSH